MKNLILLFALALVFSCKDSNQLELVIPVGEWKSDEIILNISRDTYEYGKLGEIQKGDVIFNEKYIVLIDHNFNSEAFKYKMTGRDTLSLIFVDLQSEMVFVKK